MIAPLWHSEFCLRRLERLPSKVQRPFLRMDKISDIYHTGIL